MNFGREFFFNHQLNGLAPSDTARGADSAHSAHEFNEEFIQILHQFTIFFTIFLTIFFRHAFPYDLCDEKRPKSI